MDFKRKSLIVIIPILTVSLLSLGAISNKNNIPAETSATSQTYTNRDKTTYYSSFSYTNKTDLLSNLHILMDDTHDTFTTYTDLKTPSVVIKIDGYNNDSNYITEFYSQTPYSSAWGGGATGTWNREHVWCQSLSNGLWGETGGGSDLHHLRPAESTLNSSRSNSPYGLVTPHNSTTAKYPKDTSNNYISTVGGYKTGDVFEPIDSVKGDVARIILYMYVHYNSASNLGISSYTDINSAKYGSLPITNICSPSSASDCFDLLVSWNKSDPVSTDEQTRNDEVAKYQGNRNPFIDYPNFVDILWGAETITLTMDETKSVNVGSTVSCAATLSNATGTINYTSSNSTVASVNSTTGLVTGNKTGQATITASITINGTTYSDTCLVTVGDSISSISVSANPSNKTVYAGDFDGTGLQATINYASGSNSTVSWGDKNLSASLSNGNTINTKVLGPQEGKLSYSGFTSTNTFSFFVTNENAVIGGTSEPQQGDTYTSSNALSGSITSWTNSGTSSYSDGTIKFDGTGDYIINSSIWSNDYTLNMSKISASIMIKNNASSTDTSLNAMTIYAMNGETEVASIIKTGGFSSSSAALITFDDMTIPSGSVVTGLKLVYSNKSSGNMALTYVTATPTYLVETSGAAALEQASSFSAFVLSYGENASGKCDVIIPTITAEYSYMPNETKVLFTEENYNDAYTRYQYFQEWWSENYGSSSTLKNSSLTDSSIYLTISILLISSVSIICFVAYKKKQRV